MGATVNAAFGVEEIVVATWTRSIQPSVVATVKGHAFVPVSRLNWTLLGERSWPPSPASATLDGLEVSTGEPSAYVTATCDVAPAPLVNVSVPWVVPGWRLPGRNEIVTVGADVVLVPETGSSWIHGWSADTVHEVEVLALTRTVLDAGRTLLPNTELDETAIGTAPKLITT